MKLLQDRWLLVIKLCRVHTSITIILTIDLRVTLLENDHLLILSTQSRSQAHTSTYNNDIIA